VLGTQTLHWQLSDADMQALGAMGVCRRMVDGAVWVGPHSPYRTLHDLWDEDTPAEPTPQPLMTPASAPACTHLTPHRSHPCTSPQETLSAGKGQSHTPLDQLCRVMLPAA
jgi:hypothetical protein